MARLIFFGNERLATGVTTSAPVLQALVAAGHEVVALVVAQKDTGASRRARPLEVVSVAEQLGIPVLAPAKLGDISDQLGDLQAEAGVLVAYGKMVPSAIIDLFPRGIINIHPSLLPKHRGSIPIEAVMLQGELATGVSLMQLAPEMDAGPVFAQASLALGGDEPKQVLADQLLNLGKDLLITHLLAILDGSLQPQAQDDHAATYDERIDKAVGELDFTKPAVQLAREVRAYAGWPRSRATIANIDVIITAAHAIDGQGAAGSLWLTNKQLGLHTPEGILVIDELIPAGKKPMSGSAFLAGYHLAQ